MTAGTVPAVPAVSPHRGLTAGYARGALGEPAVPRAPTAPGAPAHGEPAAPHTLAAALEGTSATC